MRKVARRLLPAISGLLLAATTAGLAAAPAARAAADATWTGLDTTPGWSQPSNWGGSAPGSTIGTLSFPDLGTCDATIDTCYASEDATGAYTANELAIDTAQDYQISAGGLSDELTLLGNGLSPNVGLDAPSETGFAFPTISLPIVLGADQHWDIAGGSEGFSFLDVANVSGNHALELDLSGDGNLYTTSLDTGALSIDGNGNVYLISDANNDTPVLPAAGITIGEGSSNGQPGLNVQMPGTTSGPIDASAGVNYGNQLTVGQSYVPEATLGVSGDVNLGPGTAFGFSIDGNDTTPAVDSSEMTVDGNVSLNGARMGMSQGAVDTSTNACVNLTPGNTYTLLTTSGGIISGTMHYWDGTGYGSSVDEGQTSATPTPFGQNCTGGGPTEAYINYGSTTVTETIAAAPTSTAAPTISGTAVVGQTLNVASTGSWSAYPAPTYTYAWLSCASGNCTPISGASGSSFVVTSAQEGHTIEVQVTATNSLGNASASSSASATVPTPTVTNTTPTTTPTTTTPTPAPTLPPPAVVSLALSGIGHPSGTKAITALLKHASFASSFSAPSGGSLRVVWTTVVTTGTGKHKKHRTVTVASGSGQASGAGKIRVSIHLTAAGKALLKAKPRSLAITATEKFEPTGGSWTTITKHFTL